MSARLAVIVPTFNERENIRPLFEAVKAALEGIEWELIVVDDDSPDGTADFVRALSREDSRIRCIHRIHRRGLSSACIEGMMSTAADYLAVMDADMQHDETLLPKMYNELESSDYDLVVGSRYVAGGSVGEWSEGRRKASLFATVVAKRLLRVELRDPMSGFFMVRAPFFRRYVRRLTGIGFKILLDLVMSARGAVRLTELGFTFRPRHAGESKLDVRVLWEYVELLLAKTIGRVLPIRFVIFVMVGMLGVGFHLAVLGGLMFLASTPFIYAQAAAALAAMTANFTLNNILTFRGASLRGAAWFAGLLKFYVACAIGAVINLELAGFLYNGGAPWWLAGVLGGAGGAVWNFAITSVLVWSRGRARDRKLEDGEAVPSRTEA